MAQFIHGERSSPEVWRKSFNQTVGRINQDIFLYYATYLIPFMRFAVVAVTSAMDERNKRVFDASIYNLDSQLELYHRHNALVRVVVPQDQMFEYDPKKGYEPLCQFLNFRVPMDEQGNKLDFPHANNSEGSRRGLKFATALGCAIWCVVIGGAYLITRRIVLSII